MQFNEVPVACVEPSWLQKAFIPQAIGLLASDPASVHLMPTDSHRESDFLCARVAKHLRDVCGLRVSELVLHPTDPTLSWEKLFGLPDTPPATDLRSQCDVLVVRGGNYLPQWFITQHMDFVRDIAVGFGVNVLMPVSRALTPPAENAPSVIDIPSLGGTPPATVKAFVLSSIERLIPDLRDEGERIDRSSLRQELCEFLLEEGAESRTRIEDALEFYASTMDPETHDSILAYAQEVKPSAAGLICPEPAQVESQHDLKVSFERNMAELTSLGEPFRSETDYLLLEPTHDLPHPFDSSDPQHWFIGVVSLLGCLFFDAGKRTGLPIVLSYRVEEGRTLSPVDEGDTFSESLRLLRTFFQHSLNPDNPKDKRTLAAAKEWFRETTQIASGFSRYNARLCLGRLLSDFGETVDHISSVVRTLCSNNVQIRKEMLRELDRASRTIAEHEVDNAIKKVVEEQELNVDPDEVVKRHQAKIMKEVKTSACRIENLPEELLRICEKYCYDTARQPPSVGKWLRQQGLSPRQTGDSIKELTQLWESNTSMTPSDFLRLAEEKASVLKQTMGD